MSDTLNAKINAYYRLRADYEEKKAASNEAAELMNRAEAELVDYMLVNQIRNVKREDGTQPLLASSITISCTSANAEEIRAWIREEIGDDKDYIETLPIKSEVLRFVKKKIEQEKFDASELPQFLNVNTRPTLRVNGWKKARGEA